MSEDSERAKLAVELQVIAARVCHDASALTRAVAWLSDPAMSPRRIGAVLHRYAVEHKQAYAEQVEPIAEAVRRLDDNAKGGVGKPSRWPTSPKTEPSNAVRLRLCIAPPLQEPPDLPA